MGINIDEVIKRINGIIEANDYTTMTSTSFITEAFESFGVNVESVGNVTYTNNMYKGFTQCGFDDVTFAIDLFKGKGLRKGDVLLNHCNHCAIMISDTELAEFLEPPKMDMYKVPITDWHNTQYFNKREYYNFPWNCVLRYKDSTINTLMPELTELNAGDRITLNNANLYNSTSIKTAKDVLTGDYYIYDIRTVNNRIRITNLKTNVGLKPIAQHTLGWVDIDDIEKMIY